jgi:hypothetical protein
MCKDCRTQRGAAKTSGLVRPETTNAKLARVSKIVKKEIINYIRNIIMD